MLAGPYLDGAYRWRSVPEGWMEKVCVTFNALRNGGRPAFVSDDLVNVRGAHKSWRGGFQMRIAYGFEIKV